MTQPFPAQKVWSLRISSWKDGAAVIGFYCAGRKACICVRRKITTAPSPIKRGGEQMPRSSSCFDRLSMRTFRRGLILSLSKDGAGLALARIGTRRAGAGAGGFRLDIGAADPAGDHLLRGELRRLRTAGALAGLARAPLQLPALVPAPAEPHEGDHGN